MSSAYLKMLRFARISFHSAIRARDARWAPRCSPENWPAEGAPKPRDDDRDPHGASFAWLNPQGVGVPRPRANRCVTHDIVASQAAHPDH
eukprot:3909944-Pyramimonas_sp.AAC.1